MCGITLIHAVCFASNQVSIENSMLVEPNLTIFECDILFIYKCIFMESLVAQMWPALKLLIVCFRKKVY